MFDKRKQLPLVQNSSLGSNQPYWQKITEQTKASNKASGIALSNPGAASYSPVKEVNRSAAANRKSSSYLSMNASNSTKRGYIERELEKLRQSELIGLPPSQREDTTRQEKNLIHQLNYLDAIEQKKPRSYASEYGFTHRSGSFAAEPVTSTDRESTDTRQAYHDYLKEARTPSVDEYQLMKKAGTKMSFGEYAHKKLNAPTISYSQYTYNKKAFTPEIQQFGDIIAVKKPTETYYARKGRSVLAQDNAAAVLPPVEDKSFPGEYLNALGASGAEVKAAEEKRKELQGRYERNKVIENTGMTQWLDNTGHLNGQARDGIGSMLFGPSIDEKASSPFLRDTLHKFNDEVIHAYPFGSVSNAGCGAIAVFNALHDLGKDVSLSQIIYDTERNGGMLWNGWFGTKTYKVDDMLEQYGVESEVSKKPEAVDSDVMNGKIKDGQIFVASAYNDSRGLRSGIHTFEIVYSPSQNEDKPWTVYNLNPMDTEGTPYTTFSEIFVGDVLQINTIKMGEEP